MQVRLAEPDAAVDEERVVPLARDFCATAWQTAWANWFPLPTMNVSNVLLGMRLLSSRPGSGPRGRSSSIGGSSSERTWNETPTDRSAAAATEDSISGR